jgi:hypothetical protein
MRYTRGNAFGNNPSGLYGVWDWLLGLPVFYLGPQDAVLWVGCTPPPLAYFSARSYVFSSPWPNATVLFASLGDSNNIETVNTTAGGPCNRTTAIITTGEVAGVVAGHCRWRGFKARQPLLLHCAGDLNTAAAVTNALVAAGLPASAVNVDLIPPSLVTMGRGVDSR